MLDLQPRESEARLELQVEKTGLGGTRGGRLEDLLGACVAPQAGGAKLDREADAQVLVVAGERVGAVDRIAGRGGVSLRGCREGSRGQRDRLPVRGSLAAELVGCAAGELQGVTGISGFEKHRSERRLALCRRGLLSQTSSQVEG